MSPWQIRCPRCNGTGFIEDMTHIDIYDFVAEIQRCREMERKEYERWHPELTQYQTVKEGYDWLPDDYWLWATTNKYANNNNL